MGLSSELISQFAKITNDNKKVPTESTIYGTTVMLDGRTYVKLDGSDRLTPVETTTVVGEDERVIVTIKNHTATITGNISSPAAQDKSVKELGNKIDEFDTVIADTIKAETANIESAIITKLDGKYATFEGLDAKYASVNSLEAAEADIRDLTADNVEINKKLTARDAEIDQLKANSLSVEVADAKYATIETLEGINADFNNLQSTYGDFVDLTTDKFEAIEGTIADLDVGNLDAKYATIAVLQSDYITAEEIATTYVTASAIAAEYAKISTLESDYIKTTDLEANYITASMINSQYAEIDLANVDKASIGTVLANIGLITSATIVDGHVTGYLDSVEVNANNITAGTLTVDRLIISGTDKSIIYAINNAGELVSAETDTINGDVITKRTIAADHIIAGAITANEIHSSAITSDKIATNAVTADKISANAITAGKIAAKAVTADKISVTDLNAIVAKIGNFNIGSNSIYSGAKSSVGNTTRGIYMDTDGQMNLGDSNNYLKFYKDQNGNYKLDIAADSLTFGSGTSVEEAINDVQDSVDNIQVGGRNFLLKSENIRIWYCAYGGTQTHKVSTTTATAYIINGRKLSNLYHVQWAAGGTGDMRFGTNGTNYDAGYVNGNTLDLSNKTYTMSVWVMSNVDCTLYSYVTRGYNDSDGDQKAHTLAANTWTRITHSRTFSSRADLDTVRVRFTQNAVAATMAFAMAKVELGNKATDWTPAPEDVATDITNAGKTATNHLYYDSSTGLVIGDGTKVPTGNNVLIDNDSVDIRNGNTVLASYGANTIYLGKNKDAAIVDICDGFAQLKKYALDAGGEWHGLSIISANAVGLAAANEISMDTTAESKDMLNMFSGTFRMYTSNPWTSNSSEPTVSTLLIEVSQNKKSSITSSPVNSSAGIGATSNGVLTLTATNGESGAYAGILLRTSTSPLVDITGNTTVGGTLSVTGNTTLTTLTASGALTAKSTLAVTGATTVSNTITGNSLVSKGALSVATTATITGATTVSNTITGNSLVSKGALSVATTATITGALTAKSTLAVTGATTLTGALTAKSTASISGDTTLGGILYMPNNKPIYMKNASGAYRQTVYIQGDNLYRFGYGGYANSEGRTDLLGNEIKFYVKYANDTNYKPYWDGGDTVSFEWYGAGFISSSASSVYFSIPLSKPMIGGCTVSISSVDGMAIRQNNTYVYGSSASSYAKPSSYAAVIDSHGGFVRVKATMSNTTNAINNAPCGIAASIKLTFAYG